MSVTIVGLGPAGIDHLDTRTQRVLDVAMQVIVRTEDHPAARELAERRSVTSCDDLYEAFDDFDEVYAAVASRVLDAASDRDVVFAVPGSPVVGERTVPLIRDAAAERGIEVSVLPATSFLELAYATAGIDPIVDGLQVLDARDLPDPLPLHVPTIITQLDSPLRASDVAVALGRTLDDESKVVVLDRLGDDDAVVLHTTVAGVATYHGGPRTSLYVPSSDVGLLGLVATNRILRRECPWDRKQTHHTLLTHLVEEAYEAADAIGQLPVDAPGGAVDFGTYAEVEDELGDLLLQVIFHATLASEAGVFDIDEVAEINRRKLVRRHPHVFGEVDVAGADEVLANWEQIKQIEKQRESLMDDVPAGMPAIARASKVQKRAASVKFDWDSPGPVFEVLRNEIAELEDADGDPQGTMDELGDVLFTTINLARHLRVDPEAALRRSVDRFMDRFRAMESGFASAGRSIADVSQQELDAAWSSAKETTMGGTGQST